MNKVSTIISAAALSFAGIAANAENKPNIIVFLVDDMGLMDTSLPFVVDENGNPIEQPLNRWYRTPNMERLAETGIRFSTFYAQSVSSPSRTSLMTGLIPNQTTELHTDRVSGTGKVSIRVFSLFRVYCILKVIKPYM